MNIGIPNEHNPDRLERRVSLLPNAVSKLVKEGHHVFAEKSLGKGIHIEDEEYVQAGAKIIGNRKDVFNKSILVKIKPPLPSEFKLLKNNILFSMLHAEQNPQYVKALIQNKIKAIAMEDIQNHRGERLIQCSDISGEQGMIMAFHHADKKPHQCNVLVLGYGDVSSSALKVALSLSAHVKILRKSEYPFIKDFLKGTDIVVNGIEWPKKKRQNKEYLITNNMLSLLNKGAIILDLSVDYPNPIQPCHPSNPSDPIYTFRGIRCISIYGYPKLAPLSSSQQYSKQILPILYLLEASLF